MADDRLRVPVRDVLALTGDRALPARPFSALVEVPVRASTVRSERPTHRIAMAVAAVLVLLVGVVGLRAVGGRDVTTTTVVASRSERTVAVPLYVPPGMALVSAGVETSVTPAADGTPLEAAVAVWERSDATLVISSSPAGLVPEPSGDRELTLRTGATAVVDEQNSITFMWWQHPDGGPTVGIRSAGLELDDLVAVADSMWYVTPALWADLTDHAGFASIEESDEGYDPWSPSTDTDLGDLPAVFVDGSLQQGFTVRFLGGSNGMVFVGYEAAVVDRCGAAYDEVEDPDAARPVVLSGGAEITAFVVGDAAAGPGAMVAAEQHPGLPSLRFGVTSAVPVDGRVLVRCERGAS